MIVGGFGYFEKTKQKPKDHYFQIFQKLERMIGLHEKIDKFFSNYF
jgi:hypothetical protein